MNMRKINRGLLSLLMLASILLTITACGNQKPVETDPTQPTVATDPQDQTYNRTAFLGNNLYITYVGSYIGAYMEDGSNEEISDVLMIILENKGETDLQLARISLEYADFTAHFEVTNLPAGQSAVLLEKERHEYVDAPYYGAKTENLVFFSEEMKLLEDKLKITGSSGSLTVENLTDEELGEIYIYYKNSAADGLFYGGITYRARVEAGLKPGKQATVMTSHYYPNACTIVDVKIAPTQTSTTEE